MVNEGSSPGGGMPPVSDTSIPAATAREPASIVAKGFQDGPHPSCGARGASHPPARKTENGHAAPIYGALDLGTNNCRLLVARPSRRGFQVIDAFSRIIRLGEGVSQTGRLSDDAMRRTLEALKICSDKMRRRNVARSRLIATEACRIAENGAEFVERVREEVGLDIEVISRETEAKLAVAGCASLLDRQCDWALVFDIGGGSTELIWLDLRRLGPSRRQTLGDRARVHNAIVGWTSLAVGVVTLAEKFGGRAVDEAVFEAMVGDVMLKLGAFEAEHGFSRHVAAGNAHLLGTSGTVTTVAGIHLRLDAYNRNRVDGCWLTADETLAVSRELLRLSYEARTRQPCIGPDRADLVLAGCAILEAIMRLWPCQRLRVADRGLREGILTSLIAEDTPVRRNGHQYR
jgi:exopolyphosphatase/guanosine-5'-triphosphate,3'-diphosphate pyrophosphatase